MSKALFSSAVSRVQHFSDAILWFAGELEKNPSFQSTFQTFVEAANRATVDCATAVRQVHFVAIGKSAGVSQLAVAMLNSVGIRACFLHPTEAFHGDFGSVQQNDSVVCISNTGRTKEILEIIPHLRERGCQILAVTSRVDSPLASAADATLSLPPFKEHCPLEQAPITSTVTTLALMQLVVAATMESRNFALDTYARNHPGGSIGKRIFVRVDDLMAKGESLPKVTREDSFTECVSVMTRFAKTAVLVVEGSSLVGLIAERDLRVAMQSFGPKVFEKKARDIMNPKPIVINSGMLAWEALQLMQERPRPLNFLPVVDDAGNVAGLLHIHDLVGHGIAGLK